MATHGEKRFGPRAQTITLAVAVLALAAVFVAFALSARSAHPTSETGVQAEVLTVMDLIEDDIPAASIVTSTDAIEPEPCPSGEGTRYAIARTITLSPDFEQDAWMRQLASLFPEDDGWDTRLTTLSEQSRLSAKIVNRALIIWELVSSSDAGTVILTSETRCTVPSA